MADQADSTSPSAIRLGDFIPVSVNFIRKREVIWLSETTGRSRHEVAGLLIDFWCWVSLETADGLLPGVFLRHLPSIIGADPPFWQAAQTVGWVLELPEIGLRIPHHDRWLSYTAKRRLVDRERKKLDRSDTSDLAPPSPPLRPNQFGQTSTSVSESVRTELPESVRISSDTNPAPCPNQFGQSSASASESVRTPSAIPVRTSSDQRNETKRSTFEYSNSNKETDLRNTTGSYRRLTPDQRTQAQGLALQIADTIGQPENHPTYLARAADAILAHNTQALFTALSETKLALHQGSIRSTPSQFFHASLKRCLSPTPTTPSNPPENPKRNLSQPRQPNPPSTTGESPPSHPKKRRKPGGNGAAEDPFL